MDQSVFAEIKQFLSEHGITDWDVDQSLVDQSWVSVKTDSFKGGFLIESFSKGFEVVVKDWREGRAKWKRFGGEKLTASDRAEQKLRRKKLEVVTSERHQMVKGTVNRWLGGQAKGYVISDYMVHKRLDHEEKGPGVFTIEGVNDNRNAVVVPMIDERNEVWNVQSIYAGKGEKYFWPGGRTDGLFHVIDGANGQSKVLLGEGFATCVAARAASGLTTYCAFSCGNLEAVLRVMLRRYEASQIVLLVDWDIPSLAGQRECSRLVDKYMVELAFPFVHDTVDFPDQSIDCADTWVEHGPYYLESARNVTRDRTHPVMGRLRELVQVEEPEPRVEEKQVEVVTVEETPKVEEEVMNEIVEVKPVKPVPTFEVLEPGACKYPSLVHGFYDFIPAEGKGKDRWVPNYHEFSGYMVEKYRMRSTDGVLYGYGEGYYESWGTLRLKKCAKDLLRKNTAPGVIRGMCEMVETEAFTNRKTFEAPEAKINLANGVLDVRTREISDHSPDMFFKYKLPHVYDPNAECPNWIKFLMQTFEGNEDLVKLSGEIFGWVLVGGNPQIHAAVFLKGDGRNGKGVWLDTLKALIGRANWSAVPLDELDKPFSMVQANGKLANIVTEVSTKLLETQVFKTAVSGESVQASYKGKDVFDFDFHARMILAANKTPYLGDSTTGTHEKFLILPFDRYVEKHERILNYVGKFIYPEMSGIVNWALDGLERLAKRGAFLEVDAVNESVAEMRKEIDPFYDWWTSHLELGPHLELGKLTIGGEMYAHYTNWCLANDYRALRKIGFGRKVVIEAKKLGILILHPNNKSTLCGSIKLHKDPVLTDL